jgi:hypothetical protein
VTAEQFAYWLQGFAELNAEPPTPEQWKSINEHLQTVFVKVTPAYVPPIKEQNGFPRTLEVRPSDVYGPFDRFPFAPVITC